jgi:hypothetical protein
MGGLVSACANNPAIFSLFYERMDDSIMRQFAEYADFNDQQRAWIEQVTSEWHAWHRRSELPRYAALLRAIQQRLGAPEPVSHADVEQWFVRLESLGRALRECNPLHQAAPFLKGLSDGQVAQIARHIDQQYEEDKAELVHRSGDQYHRRRYDAMRAWFARVAFKLDERQAQILRETIAAEHDLRADELEAGRRWSAELLRLLEHRSKPDFEPRVTAHLQALAAVSESVEPAKRRASRELWVNAIARLMSGQTAEQREAFSHWLAATAETLDTVAMQPVEAEGLRWACATGAASA